jgi:hypothetical protein
VGSSPLHDHNREGVWGWSRGLIPHLCEGSDLLVCSWPHPDVRPDSRRPGSASAGIASRGEEGPSGQAPAPHPPVRRSHALPPLHRFRAITTSTAIQIGFCPILTPTTARGMPGHRHGLPMLRGRGFRGLCRLREEGDPPGPHHGPLPVGERPGKIHPTGGDEHLTRGSPQVR